jgi:hypothetical protein
LARGADPSARHGRRRVLLLPDPAGLYRAGRPRSAARLWDFATISASVVAGKSYLGAILFVLADVLMLILVIVRRRHIEPPAPN